MSSPTLSPAVPTGFPIGRIAVIASRWLAILGFAALLFLPAHYFKDDRYWLPLFSRYMALALFAMSVDLVWGYTGLLSLGQGLYFGMGVYMVGYSLKLQEAAKAADLPFEVPENIADMALPNFMEYCRLPAVPSYIAPLIHINLAATLAVVLPTVAAIIFGLIIFRPHLKPVAYFVISQAATLAIYSVGIFLVAPVSFQDALIAAAVIRAIVIPLEFIPLPLPVRGVYLSMCLQPVLLGGYLLYLLSGQEAVTTSGLVFRVLAVGVILPLAVTYMFHLADVRQRIRGVYFSLVTQALLLAAFTFVVNQQPYTGGVVGMTNLPRLEMFGITFEKVSLYLLIAGVLAACYLLCNLLVSSKFGKVLTAIRDNEYRVLAMGYDTGMYKTFIFALAGGMAGLAGALYVSALRTCGPDTLGISFSIEIVIMVAFGGRGTLAGAILGAVIINFANTYITGVTVTQPYWPIILGSLFVSNVLLLPDGLLGLFRRTALGIYNLATHNRNTAIAQQQAALAAEAATAHSPTITEIHATKV
jgi:urea ABC transporter permease protein UrtC